MVDRRILFLMFLCTGFTSIGQILFKKGSADITLVFNLFILTIGIVSYGIGAILLLFSLKIGKLSVVYPLVSISFIWVAILSWYVFGEILTSSKIIGMSIIFSGITVIGIGSEK